MSSFTDMLKKDSVKITDKSTSKSINKCCGCPAAVKIATYGKAYKEVSDGRQVILFDGKPYYGCTRPCFEDKDKCWRHSTAKESLIFDDLLKNGGCLLKEDNVYFDKHRPKVADSKNPVSKSKSTNEYIVKINIKHSDLIEDIKKKVESYFSSNTLSSDKSDDDTAEEDVSPFETSLTASELQEVPVEDDSGMEIINKLMEESDTNESAEQHLSSSDSGSGSDSGSDSDSCSESETEMDSIRTKSKYGERELAIDRDDENKVYDPDTSDLLGKLIVVEDAKAPISDSDDDCIVGASIEIDDTEYMKCALTNRVYDFETLELVGLGKEKNGTWILKKTKKK